MKILKCEDVFTEAYKPKEPKSKEIETFKNALALFLKRTNDGETEEHNKNHIAPFLQSFAYQDIDTYEINTAGKVDLAISKNKQIEVLIEVKKPRSHTNKIEEMVRLDDMNRKALGETILYYLREVNPKKRNTRNDKIKHIIITNNIEWFIIDVKVFDALATHPKMVESYIEIDRDKTISKTKTKNFYSRAEEIINEENLLEHFKFLYIDLSKLTTKKDFTQVYKIFTPRHLLRELGANDSNKLNKNFYTELLHIIGLEETGKSMKLIQRKEMSRRDKGSLLENTISKLETEFGISDETKLFDIALELNITWLNRILFLKLLEARLINIDNKNDTFREFITPNIISDFNILNALFFEVLAKKKDERHNLTISEFSEIPYLNSSLFETTELEKEYLRISGLKDHLTLKVLSTSKTVLDKTKEYHTLNYLLTFLNSYNFGGATKGDVPQEDTLINASVLGLIFEKINGYKDGSFFTPSFITTYMTRRNLEQKFIDKMNETFEIQLKTFEELKAYSNSRFFETEFVNQANKAISSITLIDPAVGSGHFLVSALNEMICLKSELRILHNLNQFQITNINDELIIENKDGSGIFEYKKTENNTFILEIQDAQESLFKEKQQIIENQLFGVDINPNSVKITRLRLWIELLKHSYYKNNELVTLPNIDINIKCGNSLISRFALNDTDNDERETKKLLKKMLPEYKSLVKEYKSENNKSLKEKAFKLIKEKKADFQDMLNDTSKFSKLLSKYVREYRFDMLPTDLAQLAMQKELRTQLSFFDDIEPASKITQEKILKRLLSSFKTIKDKERAKIYDNSFEWRFEFPEILDEEGNFKGFDIVIGNPPYIRVQGLKKHHPEACEFYEKEYITASGSYDIYVLFIELAYKLLSSKGRVSFILPHKFLVSDFGKNTREYLAQHKAVESLLHFGSDMVFDDASTYTCIMTLTSNNTELKYKTLAPKDIFSNFEFDSIPYSKLNGNKWHLTNPQITQVLNKINKQPLQVKDVFSKIFQGIATSADKVYLLQLKAGGLYSQSLEKKVDIEDGLLKPLLKGKDLSRYKVLRNEHSVIFPYILNDGQATPMTEEYLKQNFPNGYNYLKENEMELRGREKGRFDNNEEWFLFSRKQGLNGVEKDKIITPDIALKSQMALDTTGFYHGTTLYSFIKKETIEESYDFYLALFNSALMWFFIKNTSTELRGGYFRYKTKYLEPFPLPKLNSLDEQDEFISLVNEIRNLKKVALDTSSLENKIDELVYKLYDLTDEEITIVKAETNTPKLEKS